RQAAAMVREDTPGDARLVAYVVAEANETLESAALRTLLQERLPDYMLPSAIMPLESLPLTPNGKLDRRALPAVDSVLLPAAEDLTPPRTPLEAQLSQLFAEVLGAPVVGIHDSFF